MRKEKIKAVESLRKALKEAGYYSFQVDEIIREVAGDTEVSDMSDTQLDEVAAALQRTLDFAQICLKGIKPPPLGYATGQEN
ncbi:hypothetical protein [Thermanaeromonas sp. C210]|uniref:hypothetical protein n=1 Tax=Thermanaeromonas sp. C210 TaxID=2731925 RepID=UPI0015665FCC|nr:hypothetical protein [Thermanaeromonas sp. C210]